MTDKLCNDVDQKRDHTSEKIGWNRILSLSDKPKNQIVITEKQELDCKSRSISHANLLWA